VIDALGAWTPEIGSAVTAILTDTGGFRHSHITNRTFEGAAAPPKPRRRRGAGSARLRTESIGKLIGALLDG
jgi:hypothetical protein